MILGLDYDDTFTADPIFWSAMYGAAAAAGHKMLCVTWRFGTDADKAELQKALPSGMPVVYCCGRGKIRQAKRAGYKIDVWIDNFPLSEYI